MKLGSTRDLESLRPVLKKSSATGPDPVYWVFSEVSGSGGGWANVTIIAPGLYSMEYPKTFGHYHPDNAPVETYHLIEGKGVLQMQKKHFEGSNFVSEIVEEVYLIEAKPGDEIKISSEWGHSWSNIGRGPLISFDNWRAGHTPHDYEAIKKMNGLAYYLVDDGGVKPVVNQTYKKVPPYKWISAKEFNGLIGV